MSTGQMASDGLIILKPDEGRRYHLGTIKAVFKADETETDEQYAVSEWWLEPQSEGPGAHRHEYNDEIYYVIEGVCSFLIGEEWVDAPKGTFLKIPATIKHDIANHSQERAGVLNFFVPGGFERFMPEIVNWFKEKKA